MLAFGENELDETSRWLIYQRCVAAFAHERYGSMGVTVQHNVYLKGHFSQVKRQIDVLVEARWDDDISKRIIIDAKLRKSKIDINDIETMIGMMQDCAASRGVIVTATGFTDAAKKRAQDVMNILILSFDDALKYAWIYEPCLGDCGLEPKPKNYGMVLWGETLLHGTQQGLWLVLQTGTCDVCHNFHVWCWDCGKKFVIPDNQIVNCDCGHQWGSIPESEASGRVGEPTSTWLLMREDNNPAIHPVPFDRKPIR